MRSIVLGVLVVVAGAVPSLAQAPPIVEPTPVVVAPTPVATDHQMLHKYVWSTLGVDGAIHATLSSGLDQWRKSPPEWGAGRSGYAKRWVSDYAESAIGDAAKYAVAHFFHQDPSFTRCACEGVGPRLRHAVESPFMARKRDGTRVPSVASLAGIVTGRVVSSSTWYPAPLGTRDGLRHAGTSLISKIAIDVFREFRPKRSN